MPEETIDKTLYRLEPCGRGCPTCGAGEFWDIVGPDDIALSTSWGDKEHAEELVEMLNDAYLLGKSQPKESQEAAEA